MANPLAISGKLEGVDSLLAKFANVRKTTRSKYLRKGLTKAGKLMQKAAKANVAGLPGTAGRERTGLLQRSLIVKVKANSTKKKEYALIGPKRGMTKQIGTTANGKPIIEDPANIAHLVEYGHGGPHPAPPHPFMRPAFDNNKAAAQQLIADELTSGIIALAQGVAS